MGVHDRGEVEVAQDVAVQHHRALVEVALGVLDGAARSERRVLDGVVDAEPEVAPVAEDGLDALGPVGEGEDDLPDPRAREQVELVAQEGPIHHGNDGLGGGERERTQARPFASGQDDGFHRGWREHRAGVGQA